jgi:hypothetical protein
MADDTSPRNPNDTPSVRTWTVPTTFLNQEGVEVPAVENAQIALNEAAIILMRLGGVVTIAPKRVQLPAQGDYGERWETEYLVVRWQSFPAQPPKATPTVEIADGGSPAESSTE